MGKTAFLFPGQGAQYTGMGKDFYDNYEVSKEIYGRAEELLSMNIRELCFEENAKLSVTRFTQPALAVTCLAIYERVKELGLQPDYFAGLSLGEYPAVIASGAITLEEGLRLVKIRGELMETAVPEGIGGMAAVLGLDSTLIEDILKEMEGVVVIANYNCPGQLVISGEKEAVKAASVKLSEAGAKRVIPLNVSGPFHSPMLKEAGEKLLTELNSISVRKPVIPYAANVDGRMVTEAEGIRESLSKQVYSSVRWEDCVRTLLSEGVDLFVEIGPGKTLSAFLKKIDKNVTAVNVEKAEDLEKLKEVLHARG